MDRAYTLPAPAVGYPAGMVLTDYTLKEVRAMECNQCGDCCDGTSPHVKTDPVVGLPLFVWDKPDEDSAFHLPEDRYAARFGRPLIQPVVRGDGGLVVGGSFERDGHGDEHRSFQCAAFVRESDDRGGCSLWGNRAPDPERPYHCGAFPVFGMEADQAVRLGGAYIPHTSALPRCTWYGMRIVKELA
jgi:uncharacterized protein (DUF779 family)